MFLFSFLFVTPCEILCNTMVKDYDSLLFVYVFYLFIVKSDSNTVTSPHTLKELSSLVQNIYTENKAQIMSKELLKHVITNMCFSLQL